MIKLNAALLSRPLRVLLIGAGGNGCEALECLSRIHLAMIARGNPNGLHVTVIDDAIVRESNIVRQRFWPCDIGQYKAIVSVNRYNMGLNLQWEGLPIRWPVEAEVYSAIRPDIIITAVDLPSVRCSVAKCKPVTGKIVWLDLGNLRDSGQAVIGELGKGKRSPHVLDHYPQIREMPDDTTKSCSAAASVASQDVFINPGVTLHGMQLLWQLISTGECQTNVVVVSLASNKVLNMPFSTAV